MKTINELKKAFEEFNEDNIKDRISYWKENAYIFGRDKRGFLKFGLAYIDASPRYISESGFWKCVLNEGYRYIFEASKEEIKIYNLDKLRIGEKIDILTGEIN